MDEYELLLGYRPTCAKVKRIYEQYGEASVRQNEMNLDEAEERVKIDAEKKAEVKEVKPKPKRKPRAKKETTKSKK